MVGRTLYFEDRGDRFDRVIEGLLIAALAFMPFLFGVVEAWSEEVVVALAAAMCICFLLKMILVEGCVVTWTWAYVPVAVFVLVAVVQLIPMPPGWVSRVSPNTVEQKTMLLADLPEAERVLSTVTVSFYTWATRHDLRLVLAALAVFAVVLNVYRRPEQVMRLLGAIVIVGAAVALLCVLQNVAGNDRIYWVVSTPHGTAHSGPFVNHSHYAQFMNLSIGAALGFIFVKSHQDFQGRLVSPEVVAEYLGSEGARVLWAVLAMVVLGVASIFVSLSRGGMISMIIAGAFTTLVVSAKKSLRGPAWVMALLALGAFVCVLYVGFDAVHDRLGSLRELPRAQGGRWQILKDIAVAWTRFPVLGTGLGTHEVVYPMFDRSTVAALASHAENEYAQAAEETGIVGLMALAAFGAMVWVAYVRTVRAPQAPIHSAVYGLGFGLMAIMIHSLSDFGQHLPANGFLSVIYCALLIRLSHMPQEGNADTGGVVSGGGNVRRYGLAGLLVACIVWGWALLGADGARRGETCWKRAVAIEAGLEERDWQGGAEEFVDLIRHAEAAAAIQPDNIIYRYWLPVYRWRAVSRTTDPNTGEILVPLSGRDSVARIAGELNEARACCPTFGATWSVLGQLERFVLDRDEGEEHIRTGYTLAPCDPTACLLAGCLDAEAGQVEQAFAKLRRAVKLDRYCFSEVAGLLVEDLQRPDLALEIVGEDPDFAERLAFMLDDDAEFGKDVDRRLLDQLEQKCRQDDTPACWYAMLARVQRKHQNAERAIECYRRALAMDYGQVQWRLSLAYLLSEEGRVVEAIHEAEVCLRLSPGLREAERLIERLSVARISPGGG